MDDHRQPVSQPCGGESSSAECVELKVRRDESPFGQSATLEASLPHALRPFVWQSGRRLLLLEREQGLWVLAELEFEPEICRYTEVRRAFYRWEREAIGALLSRTIRYGQEAAAESAELLDVWMRHRR